MLGSLQRHCALHVFRPLNPNLSLRKVSTFRAPSSPTPRSNKPPPFWTSSQQPNISSVRRISFHRQYIHFVHKISFQKRYAALEDRQTSGKVSKVYIYIHSCDHRTQFCNIFIPVYTSKALCATRVAKDWSPNRAIGQVIWWRPDVIHLFHRVIYTRRLDKDRRQTILSLPLQQYLTLIHKPLASLTSVYHKVSTGRTLSRRELMACPMVRKESKSIIAKPRSEFRLYIYNTHK